MSKPTKFETVSIKDIPVSEALRDAIANRPVVLVVDDESVIAYTLAEILNRKGYAAIPAYDAEEALETALVMPPELLLTDVVLPGMSGIEVCRQLRAANVQTPIIILSAIGDEIDKVLLLEIGADDYMVKPFAPREMIARVRALLRRRRSNLDAVVSFGDVEVDRERLTVTCQGQEVKMTAFEYKLLLFFLGNVDRALPRQLVLSALWGYSDDANSRTLDAHVCKLRRKFERDPGAPRHFLTIHGVGYRFKT